MGIFNGDEYQIIKTKTPPIITKLYLNHQININILPIEIISFNGTDYIITQVNPNAEKLFYTTRGTYYSKSLNQFILKGTTAKTLFKIEILYSGFFKGTHISPLVTNPTRIKIIIHIPKVDPKELNEYILFSDIMETYNLKNSACFISTFEHHERLRITSSNNANVDLIITALG